MNYKIWNRKDTINGKEANHFLNREPFKSETGDIILIYNGDRVSQVECKSILANVYGIDPTLPLDAFMAEYEKALAPVEAELEEVSE